MRRLVHISDLHFGTTIPGIVEALVEDVTAFQPDLVIVTGDVTQRARRGQFEQARSFLDALRCPSLVVPGNHDIAPLYRPLSRLFAPYARYRRHIAAELERTFEDAELLVLGLNTVEPLKIQEGSVSRAQLEWIRHQAELHAGKFRVLAAHHPLASITLGAHGRVVRRHRALTRALDGLGFELCLTGHLHQSFSAPFAAAAGRGHSTLVVRASTASSHRVRGGHGNAYNRLLVDLPDLSLVVRSWDGARFGSERVERFARKDGAWHVERRETLQATVSSEEADRA